jgi:serine/threonine-protein kinase RsbT
MPVLKADILPVRTDQDVVMARQAVRRLTKELGFSLVDQTKMVTAASELARNTLTHGHGGEMHYELVQDGDRQGLRLSFVDEGPGIANLTLAMTDGWTSGNGLGMGLSGTKRLVNDFHIESQLGHGTRVTITRWRAGV